MATIAPPRAYGPKPSRTRTFDGRFIPQTKTAVPPKFSPPLPPQPPPLRPASSPPVNRLVAQRVISTLTSSALNIGLGILVKSHRDHLLYATSPPRRVALSTKSTNIPNLLPKSSGSRGCSAKIGKKFIMASRGNGIQGTPGDVNKPLPSKPVLRPQYSPERRSLYDAEDLRSTSLDRNYPPITPEITSSPADSVGGGASLFVSPCKQHDSADTMDGVQSNLLSTTSQPLQSNHSNLDPAITSDDTQKSPLATGSTVQNGSLTPSQVPAEHQPAGLFFYPPPLVKETNASRLRAEANNRSPTASSLKVSRQRPGGGTERIQEPSSRASSQTSASTDASGATKSVNTTTTRGARKPSSTRVPSRTSSHLSSSARDSQKSVGLVEMTSKVSKVSKYGIKIKTVPAVEDFLVAPLLPGSRTLRKAKPTIGNHGKLAVTTALTSHPFDYHSTGNAKHVLDSTAGSQRSCAGLLTGSEVFMSGGLMTPCLSQMPPFLMQNMDELQGLENNSDGNIAIIDREPPNIFKAKRAVVKKVKQKLTAYLPQKKETKSPEPRREATVTKFISNASRAKKAVEETKVVQVAQAAAKTVQSKRKVPDGTVIMYRGIPCLVSRDGDYQSVHYQNKHRTVKTFRTAAGHPRFNFIDAVSPKARAHGSHRNISRDTQATTLWHPLEADHRQADMPLSNMPFLRMGRANTIAAGSPKARGERPQGIIWEANVGFHSNMSYPEVDVHADPEAEGAHPLLRERQALKAAMESPRRPITPSDYSDGSGGIGSNPVVDCSQSHSAERSVACSDAETVSFNDVSSATERQPQNSSKRTVEPHSRPSALPRPSSSRSNFASAGSDRSVSQASNESSRSGKSSRIARPSARRLVATEQPAGSRTGSLFNGDRTPDGAQASSPSVNPPFPPPRSSSRLTGPPYTGPHAGPINFVLAEIAHERSPNRSPDQPSPEDTEEVYRRAIYQMSRRVEALTTITRDPEFTMDHPEVHAQTTRALVTIGNNLIASREQLIHFHETQRRLNADVVANNDASNLIYTAIMEIVTTTQPR